MHLCLSRAFQWYQKYDKSNHGLGDVNMINKINKLFSFINRFDFFWLALLALVEPTLTNLYYGKETLTKFGLFLNINII
jgi:hypothetical protein